jgi:hypothetical protein
VAGGNKQRDDVTKEDVSTPTVLAEAVMLTCVIDAHENRDVAVIDIPNAFVQTVVKDEEHRMIVRIRGPLVDILVSIAPEVYGLLYVSTNKSGQKVLLVQCLSLEPWWPHYVLQKVHEESHKPRIQDQSI